MQKISNIKSHFLQSLHHLEDEVEPLFYYALNVIHQIKRSDLILNPDLLTTNMQEKTWHLLIEHLKINKPIQYFFGSQNFYGIDFFVNDHTLIPRPETEELVDWIIKNHLNQNIKILDIGTGSGCIAISLAKFLPDAKVSAIDISLDAIEIAKKNALSHQVEVEFIHQDILQAKILSQTYDIIVSNPPYIRQLEKAEIKPNVLDNEPHQALFVSDHDPLIFYRKILELAKVSLTNNGVVYFEINQYLANDMLTLAKTFLYSNIELKRDFKGNFRMMRVKPPRP